MATPEFEGIVAELPKLGQFDMAVGHAESLSQPWVGRVLLSMLYGPSTRYMMTKMVNHFHGTAVLVSSTETILFHRYVFGHATAVLFMEGRTRLSRTGAPVPVALVAYGEDDALALRRADIKGHFVWLDSAKRTGERSLA